MRAFGKGRGAKSNERGAIGNERGESYNGKRAFFLMKSKWFRESHSRQDFKKAALFTLEKLAIMGANWGPPLDPPNTILLWSAGGFSEALNWAPMMPRDTSLSDSYAPDGFPSLLQKLVFA